MVGRIGEPAQSQTGHEVGTGSLQGRTLRDLDAVDLRILVLLQENGRRSNMEMARIIGVSEPTVRKRLERLVSDRIVKVTAVLNPRMTGYSANILMGIRTQPGRLLEVGEHLARMEEAVYVGYITGRYDIMVEFLFRDHAALMDFLTHGLTATAGLVSTESFQILRTDKINYDWKVPAEFLSGWDEVATMKTTDDEEGMGDDA